MRRFNRAQIISVLIALGAALIVFGGWVTTLGRGQIHVAVSRAFAGPPGAFRQIVGPTGVAGGRGPRISSPIFEGPGASGGRIVISPASFPSIAHAGLPLYGLMLIFLGLIAIWAVAAFCLLRDRSGVVVLREETTTAD